MCCRVQMQMPVEQTVEENGGGLRKHAPHCGWERVVARAPSNEDGGATFTDHKMKEKLWIVKFCL